MRRGAAADLVQNNQRPRRGLAEDRRCLKHLHHERVASRRKAARGAGPAEELVNDTDPSAPGRNEGAEKPPTSAKAGNTGARARSSMAARSSQARCPGLVGSGPEQGRCICRASQYQRSCRGLRGANHDPTGAPITNAAKATEGLNYESAGGPCPQTRSFPLLHVPYVAQNSAEQVVCAMSTSRRGWCGRSRAARRCLAMPWLDLL